MKREEIEANGDEGTKYRKEPSPCPICNKVSSLDTSEVRIESTQAPRALYVCTGVLLQE